MYDCKYPWSYCLSPISGPPFGVSIELDIHAEFGLCALLSFRLQELTSWAGLVDASRCAEYVAFGVRSQGHEEEKQVLVIFWVGVVWLKIFFNFLSDSNSSFHNLRWKESIFSCAEPVFQFKVAKSIAHFVHKRNSTGMWCRILNWSYFHLLQYYSRVYCFEMIRQLNKVSDKVSGCWSEKNLSSNK